jgi:hypothetical protein
MIRGLWATRLPRGHVLAVSRRLPLARLQLVNADATRPFQTTSRLSNIPQWPNPPVPQPQVTPYDTPGSGSGSASAKGTAGGSGGGEKQQGTKEQVSSFLREWASSSSFQAALTTVVGLGMVFAAGVGYLEWYKYHVLHRVCPCIPVIA